MGGNCFDRERVVKNDKIFVDQDAWQRAESRCQLRVDALNVQET